MLEVCPASGRTTRFDPTIFSCRKRVRSWRSGWSSSPTNSRVRALIFSTCSRSGGSRGRLRLKSFEKLLKFSAMRVRARARAAGFFGARMKWQLHDFPQSEGHRRLPIRLDEQRDLQSDESPGLRVRLQLLYRNIPGLEEIDLFPIPPSEGPPLAIGTVPVRRIKLDTLFKVTLVLTL